MTTSFVGKEEVAVYRSIVIERALRLYANTGMRPNRAYTPTAMLRAASDITGLIFRRGQYVEAADAIKQWREMFAK